MADPNPIVVANKLLAGLGLGLVATGVAGAFLHWNAGLVATFVFLGVGCVVISVFEPRMEGKFHLSPTSIDLNLVQKAVSAAENQLREGSLRNLEEVL